MQLKKWILGGLCLVMPFPSLASDVEIDIMSGGPAPSGDAPVSAPVPGGDMSEPSAPKSRARRGTAKRKKVRKNARKHGKKVAKKKSAKKRGKVAKKVRAKAKKTRHK